MKMLNAIQKHCPTLTTSQMWRNLHHKHNHKHVPEYFGWALSIIYYLKIKILKRITFQRLAVSIFRKEGTLLCGPTALSNEPLEAGASLL